MHNIKPDMSDPDNPWGSKYTDKMCLEIIEMFAAGKTRSHFCGTHLIAEDTFQKWLKVHPLFARAYKIAHERARQFYDNLRQQYLVQEFDGASINWGLFNRMYNTRFNIPDKRKVKVKGLGKSKDEREMLEHLMRAVADGELTPDEAQKLGGLIDISIKVKASQELEERIAQIEQAQKVGLTDDDFEEVSEKKPAA